MKKTIVGFIFILVIAFSVSAQTEEARKIDETTDFCCEDTITRLDTFLVELQNNPGTKGYVIFSEA
jgi:hypothetical protein